MARIKSPAMRREPSEIKFESNGLIHRGEKSKKPMAKVLDDTIASNGHSKELSSKKMDLSQPGIASLIFSVGGIYMSL